MLSPIAHASHMIDYLSHLQLQFLRNLPGFLLHHFQIFDRKGGARKEGITSALVHISTSSLISLLTPYSHMLEKINSTFTHRILIEVRRIKIETVYF